MALDPSAPVRRPTDCAPSVSAESCLKVCHLCSAARDKEARYPACFGQPGLRALKAYHASVSQAVPLLSCSPQERGQQGQPLDSKASLHLFCTFCKRCHWRAPGTCMSVAKWHFFAWVHCLAGHVISNGQMCHVVPGPCEVASDPPCLEQPGLCASAARLSAHKRQPSCAADALQPPMRRPTRLQPSTRLSGPNLARP